MLKHVLLMLVIAVFAVVAVPAAPAFANSKYASLVIDADSGVVLHQENAGKKRYPASLTKMMTLYLAFQALERGKLRMNQMLRVSSRAAAQPPSKLGLRRGGRIKVKDVIMSLIVKSANDSAVVLAEAVAGSEWQFAMMMNRMARRLGMNHTVFRNASGLHDKRQKTTAYDMARLAVALRRDYSKYYHLFNRTKFFYKGKVYKTHNRVVQRYRGADGLKTGYIRASGFNLVTSAKRSGNRIVAVVMGGRSSKSRDKHMVSLLDRAFYKISKGKYRKKELLYTGVTPVPVLRSSLTKTETASVGDPMPKFKPSGSTKLAKARVKRSDPFQPSLKELPKPALRPRVLADADPFVSPVRDEGSAAGDGDYLQAYKSSFKPKHESPKEVAKRAPRKPTYVSASNPFPRFKPRAN